MEIYRTIITFFCNNLTFILDQRMGADHDDNILGHEEADS